MNVETSKGRGPVLVILLAAVMGSAVMCCGIGTALVLPAIQAGREAKRRQEVQENLEQIGLALQNYHETHAIPAEPLDEIEAIAIPAESGDDIEAVPDTDETAGGRELETNASGGTQE